MIREPREPFAKVLAVIGALAIVRLWVSPMGNSFWLDETLVAWTIRGDFGEMIANAFASLQSIAFCTVEWLVSRISTSEACLRLPSLLAAGAALYLYYRIGVKTGGPELGLFLAALFLVTPSVAVETPNARPYAVALFLHTAALYWLLEWLGSGRLKHGLFWAACAAGAAHAHHLFVSAIPIEAVFVLGRILACKTPVPARHLTVCGLAGAILLLPALPQALRFADQRTLLSYSAQPSWPALALALAPWTVLIPVLLIVPVEWIAGRPPRWSAKRPGTEAGALALLLLIIPNVAFFAISRLTSARLFEPRYLLPAVPGAVILWGWLLCGLEPRSLRRAVLVVALLLNIIWVGGFSATPDYRREDWRAAARALPESGALVVYPGLVETRRRDWLQADGRWGYLTAPVSTYRGGLARSRTFVLPFEMGPNDTAYVERLVSGSLVREARVTLIARASFYGPAWAQWLARRLASLGFQEDHLSNFGLVQVRVFRAVRPATPG